MKETVIGYEELQGRNRCLECGDEIVYGRVNRKFCCDKCKNTFNNRRLRNTKQLKIRIQNVLEKNYSILERLLKMGILSLTMTELKNDGFNMAYFTSYAKVRRHDEYSCFDIRFIVMSGKVLSISRTHSCQGEMPDSQNVSLNLQAYVPVEQE